ncbi:50S ribosomal protein L29 [Candidatus Woesearchaeota archaeon]|nr:50S ribosomal protein L29 [Candidatus Woesearchaeota archaeon]
MAILRNKEIRSMNKDQLITKMADLNRELIKYRSQIAMGTLPENPGRIKLIKKTIAKIKTSMNNQQEEVKKSNA